MKLSFLKAELTAKSMCSENDNCGSNTAPKTFSLVPQDSTSLYSAIVTNISIHMGECHKLFRKHHSEALIFKNNCGGAGQCSKQKQRSIKYHLQQRKYYPDR